MSEMNAFIAGLMARMSLEEKVGQLNYPPTEGFDTTGVSEAVDVPERIRRGEIGGTAGGDLSSRRALQELAVKSGPQGIPLIFGVDVIHGHKTIAPIPLGLSSSWDLDLIERTAAMAAREARADGINVTWGPMVDIGYDARWGRVAEGSGELVFLGARIAEAMVRGFQGRDNDLARPDRLMATLKHFAGYGLSIAGRDYNSVEASPATLHRIMEPFRAGIRAGARSVMVAFNTINDVPATAHVELLKTLLREDWGFDGLVVTDFTAVMELVNHGIAADLEDAALLSFRAGINTDLVSEAFMRHLPDLVAAGRVSEAEIDNACREVLEAKWSLGLFADPFLGMDEERRANVTLTTENRALVREAAAKSCVLLKNDRGALPLDANGGPLAVIGPLADSRIDMQGTWAVSSDPSNNVTILEGLREAAGGATILHAKRCNIVDDTNLAARLNVHNRDNPSVIIDERSAEEMVQEALEVAAEASVVLLCLGEAKEHAGESSTRQDITFPGSQCALFDRLSAYARSEGKPLILLTVSGRPLALAFEAAHADAILHTFHPGTEGGRGIADVLFGAVEPSGRLSMAFPRHVGQLPYQSEHLPTGRPITGAGITVEGDNARDGSGAPVFRKFTTATILEGSSEPRFPVGFGLSYTTFEFGAPAANKTTLAGEDDVLEVTTKVSNTGERAGATVVQLYIRDPVASISRPVRELKGFQRVALEAGASEDVTFRIDAEALKFTRAETLSRYVHDFEEGEFEIMVGPDSSAVQRLRVHWEKGPTQHDPSPGETA